MIRILYRLVILVLLIALLPLFAMVGIFIIISSGFPILFRQKRIGKNGNVFVMYKFRTMLAQAEKFKKNYHRLNESQGPTFKIRNDPRFTRVGRFLSHTGLDELPQLINVLRGEMALVGPRPLPVSEARKLAPWMRERERVLPGIISPAILTGNYHKNFVAWMKSDVAYAKNKHFWGDFLLSFRFVPFIVRMLFRELAGR